MAFKPRFKVCSTHKPCGCTPSVAASKPAVAAAAPQLGRCCHCHCRRHCRRCCCCYCMCKAHPWPLVAPLHRPAALAMVCWQSAGTVACSWGRLHSNGNNTRTHSERQGFGLQLALASVLQILSPPLHTPALLRSPNTLIHHNEHRLLELFFETDRVSTACRGTQGRVVTLCPPLLPHSAPDVIITYTPPADSSRQTSPTRRADSPTSSSPHNRASSVPLSCRQSVHRASQQQQPRRLSGFDDEQLPDNLSNCC